MGAPQKEVQRGGYWPPILFIPYFSVLEGAVRGFWGESGLFALLRSGVGWKTAFDLWAGSCVVAHFWVPVVFLPFIFFIVLFSLLFGRSDAMDVGTPLKRGAGVLLLLVTPLVTLSSRFFYYQLTYWGWWNLLFLVSSVAVLALATFLLHDALSFRHAKERPVALALSVYLGGAEKRHLSRLYPEQAADFPEMSIENFERLLPYAVALEDSDAWVRVHASFLRDAGYSPAWYLGDQSVRQLGVSVIQIRDRIFL